MGTQFPLHPGIPGCYCADIATITCRAGSGPHKGREERPWADIKAGKPGQTESEGESGRGRDGEAQSLCMLKFNLYGLPAFSIKSSDVEV